MGRCSLLALALAACDTPRASAGGEASAGTASSSQPTASVGNKEIHSLPDGPVSSQGEGIGGLDGTAPGAAPQATTCPDGMQWIPGGRALIGSTPGAGSEEESPRFEAEVAGFCLDRTEVTLGAYLDCVTRGECSAPGDDRRFCNARQHQSSDRSKHPVNCVTWYQARDYCAARGARLPTEVEWEFAARGGAERRTYSWGHEPPNGRTCWKHAGGSCAVASFPSGAFGLFDMTGNVWEWTADSYARYPWPETNDAAKVYRGGSWSRRFPKWMRAALRNRSPPTSAGSHLGMRCAFTPEAVSCQRTPDKGCQRQVVALDCPPNEPWNGVRCAPPGAARCPAGRREQPGFGCVPEQARAEATEAASGPVTRARAPAFDADCQRHSPGKPHAYRYSGGTHAARNHVSGAAGCKNRDVGVGWNSCCCP
ncbi:MAG: SUMF1/EgtB/PvdO family nonheme iron enzyme [Polyangiaceae bacterium]|nr:SUMF1/EgtB/PvdO family nonheme iron enzyme [Polyangiaceae bacterium]MCW5791402.1 SUMF1/EgtB/PvdO family nonheme iron enzyme [Polyangiaceae bacterium]